MEECAARFEIHQKKDFHGLDFERFRCLLLEYPHFVDSGVREHGFVRLVGTPWCFCEETFYCFVSFLSAVSFFLVLANIPGLDWLKELSQGSLVIINGYLPVLFLLTLISILPIIFEWVALHYENRKTSSDIQRSVLTRYFLFQVSGVRSSTKAT